MTLTILDPNAVVGDIAGRPVALRSAGVDAEYGALRRSAILIDRSHRTRMTFEGERRAETVTGLVTNDVGMLVPGAGQYAAALTPRGKIIADVRIFARESNLLIDVPARAAEGFVAMVRKYVNPRVSRYVDRTESVADVGVFGVRAREVVAAMTAVRPDTLGALAPYAHLVASLDETPLLVVRAPDIRLEGYELMMPAELRARAWSAAAELGAVPAGLDAWEIARIEAGRPEWGLDMDDSTIPQEANLDDLHAISYTKGCYTGQETVARVHFRGHVNRHLRGLTYAGDTPLPRGAQIVDESEKAIGDVRSSAMSPRLGGIAIAMVRREVSPGAVARVRWEAGEASANVLALPFPE